MQTDLVAERYAKALLEIAADRDVDAFGGELDRFIEWMQESAELRTVLTNPSIPLNQRQRLTSAIIQRLELSRTIGNFLRLLLDRNRMRLIFAIREAFDRLSDLKEGKVRGTIRTPIPLSSPQLLQITSAVESLLQTKVSLSAQLQPSLIGGVCIDIGGKTYDGSVLGQLERMRTLFQRPTSL